MIGEAGVGDVAAKVLADLVFTDDFPDRYADATGPSDGAAIDPLGDDAQVMFGGGEQFVAFAGPRLPGRGCGRRSPLPRVVGAGDLGQILGIEQAHLQRPVGGGQCGDPGGAQRVIHRNPFCPTVVEFTQRGDARR